MTTRVAETALVLETVLASATVHAREIIPEAKARALDAIRASKIGAGTVMAAAQKITRASN